MITSPRPVPARAPRARIARVTAAGLAGLVVSLVATALPAGRAVAAPAPDAPAPASVSPPVPQSPAEKDAADRTAADRQAPTTPPVRYDQLATTVTGPATVTVSWPQPTTATTGAASSAAVTVCRTDGSRRGVVTPTSCPVVATLPANAGRFEDHGVRPGQTVSYAVLPQLDASTTGAATDATGRWGATVTVPRPRRTPTAATKATTTGGTGSVAGTVRRANGSPVAGALASVVTYDESNALVVAGSARTGTDGRYTISGLDVVDGYYGTTLCVDGSAAATAPAGGFVDTCLGDAAWDGLLADVPFRSHLGVRHGVALTGVDVVLRTGATVTGTVRGGGAPVVGASVYALNTTYGPFRTRTGSDGTYVLAGIPAGAADICVDATTAAVASGSPGWAGQCRTGQVWDGGAVPSAATSLPVPAGSTAPGVDLALTPGGAVAGVVRDVDGTPLGGVDVYVARAGDSRLTPSNGGGGGLPCTGPGCGGSDPVPAATTASNGRFAATGLAPGTYLVCYDAGSLTGPSPAGYLSECADDAPFGYPANDGIAASARRFTVATGAVTAADDATLASGAALAGKVTAAAGGAGLANVSVFVSGSNSYAYPVTTSGGTWTARGLAPGSYTVCFDASDATGGASATGYADQCFRRLAWDADTGLPANTTPVTATAGATTGAVSAALAPAGAVGGTVTTNGSPAAGVTVTVFGAEGSRRYRHDVVTGSTGGYLLTGLAPGSYRVCVETDTAAPGTTGANAVSACRGGVPWNGYSPPVGSPAVTVQAGATTSGTDIALGAGAQLSGTVTDDAGRGLGDVFVQAFTSDGSGYANTASDGTWTISGLGDAGATVCFDASEARGVAATGSLSECWNDVAWNGRYPLPTGATTVPTPAGSVTPHVDAALSSAGAVTGRVVTAGTSAALAGLSVLAFDASGTRAGWADTAVDGSFVIGGLTAGSYRTCVAAGVAPGDAADVGTLGVCARGKAWDGTSTLPAGAQVATVTLGSTTNVSTIAAAAAGAIRGTVSSTTGNPLAGVRVAVFGASSSAYATTYATTASDGSYLARGLTAGTYRVCAVSTQGTASDGGTGYRPTCRGDVPWSGVNDGNLPDGITTTTVTAGEVASGADVALPPGGVLAGIVTDASSGTGLRTTVAVFDTDGFVGTAATASNGSWRATGLPAGAYSVCYLTPYYGPSASGYLRACVGGQEWSGGYTQPVDAPNLTVAVGGVTDASLALARGAGISGRVVTAGGGGAPLSNATVVVFDGSGTRTSGSSAYSTSDGSFVVASLPAGSYRVCVDGRYASGTAPAGYLSRCYATAAWTPSSSTPPADAATVTTTAGSVVAAGQIGLVPGSAISGSLTDATSGAALAGSLSAYDASGAQVAYASVYNESTWLMKGLPAGAYRVCATAFAVGSDNDAPAGYRPTCFRNVAWDRYNAPTGATAIRTTAGQIKSGVGVALPRASGISGTVTDAVTGAGVVGASIRVFAPGGFSYLNNYYDRTTTGGGYVVTGLPAGRYTVCFDGRTVTGASSGYFSQCWQRVAWDGGYASPPSAAKVVVTAAGALKTGVNGALAPSGAVAGRVTGALTRTGLAYASVQVFAAGQTFAGSYGQTDSAGNYQIGGLQAGTYKVCFSPNSYNTTGTGYRAQCYANLAWDGSGGAPDNATAVTVTAGSTTSGIDARLANAGAVAGTVTDAAGNGLSSVDVYLYRNGRYVRSTSAYAGTFRAVGLDPGTYAVCFYGRNATGGTSAGGYLPECHADVPWNGDGTLPAGVTTVTVQARSTTTVSAALSAAGGVSGTVRDATTGAGMATFGLQAYDANGGVIGYGSSDTSGAWAIKGLAPDTTVRVCASWPFANGNSYASQCWDHVAWDPAVTMGTLPAGTTGVAITVGTLATGVDFDLTQR